MTREQQQALQAALEERARQAGSGGVASPQPVGVKETSGVQPGGASSRAQELEGVPAADRDKVSRAIDALEARAKKGSWSREKLAAEKADLLSRARAAQPLGAPAEQAPSGETPEQRRAREARKRAAEQQSQPAGETPEQRKAREARKRAADAQRSTPTGSGSSKSGAGGKAGDAKPSGQQRPVKAGAGASARKRTLECRRATISMRAPGPREWAGRSVLVWIALASD